MVEVSFDKVISHLFIIDSMSVVIHKAPPWLALGRYFANFTCPEHWIKTFMSAIWLKPCLKQFWIVRLLEVIIMQIT